MIGRVSLHIPPIAYFVPTESDGAIGGEKPLGRGNDGGVGWIRRDILGVGKTGCWECTFLPFCPEYRRLGTDYGIDL